MVYYQVVTDAALGICVLGNKVIVTCAPTSSCSPTRTETTNRQPETAVHPSRASAGRSFQTTKFVFGPDGKLIGICVNGGFVHDANGKLIVDTAGNHVLDRRQMGRFKTHERPTGAE